VTHRVIKARGHPWAPPHPLAQSVIPSLSPSLCLKGKRDEKREKETEKREKREKKEKRKKRDYLDLKSAASPCFSSHGGTRLDPFQHYLGSPANLMNQGFMVAMDVTPYFSEKNKSLGIHLTK
jgi:hypothetical protein